jgi:aminomethyltransferase
MAYVPLAYGAAGTEVSLAARGKIFTGTVAAMPFVPHRYHRKGAAQ